MSRSRAPGWLTGGIVGLLLMVMTVALLYAAYRMLGLPFVPFDFFDWLARVLPGEIIVPTIGVMIAIISALNVGPTDVVAKLAEQLMGVGTLLAIGVVAGALFFAVLQSAQETVRRRALVVGLGMGVVAGFVFLLISASLQQAQTGVNPFISGVWILAVFAVWGAAHGWAHADLSRLPEPTSAKAVLPSVVNPDSQSPSLVEVLDRRQFLIRLGGVTATVTLVGVGLGTLLGTREETPTPVDAGTAGTTPDGTANARWSQVNDLPNKDAAVQPAPGTRAEFTALEDHYRIDINTRAQRVDGAAWVLPFTGLVDTPMSFTMEQLQTEFDAVDMFITLSCISNPVGGDLISNQRWTGARFKDVLARVNPNPEARYVKITAVDGFDEIVSIDMINNDDRIILAYHWDGVPLPPEHGFPLRVYVPDLYGMKQPKWITGMELIADWQPGYWVRRGWDEVARVNTTSVIDTIAAHAAYDQNGVTYVPIGGIAYAGARTISKVQVQVDDGEWQDAQLRDPLASTSWVIWRYDWALAPGDHRFAVRAVDGIPEPQSETTRDRFPSGATGVHSRRRSF